MCGGGSGIMEAVNEAGSKYKFPTFGLTISLADEKANVHLKDELHKHLHFHFFFIRKTILIDTSAFFLIFPGGFGTLDEMFELLTLFQTNKKLPKPIFLIGTDYWKGLIAWLKNTVLETGKIKPEHLNLFKLVNTSDEILEILTEKKYRYLFLD
ncbi:LOG family protein, partial [Candidatus Margulisiibacteriota bacterium]